MEARCMRCREQVKIEEPNMIKMKKQPFLNYVLGHCGKCKTKVSRILSKEQ